MFSFNLNRLKKGFYSRLYQEDTYYLLNYATLNIKNPKLADEIWVH